jgi:hypothetical protein
MAKHVTSIAGVSTRSNTVFGNLAVSKRLNRFTLRGKDKVNAQWLMWCMVHNIEKLHRYGKNA